MSTQFSKTQIAFMNDVTEDEVRCNNCGFCNQVTIDNSRKICRCIRWDENVRTFSFCTHYTRQYDKVG